ncbi:MAG: GNAT family N-acetyltransferase [Bryobacterales bacterium]|nr:GNAT family N-acetyltransferase [Bryobacterales bacterium]
MATLRIVRARETDVPVIFDLIREFAEYEKLAHTVTATEERLRETLFGARPAAEVLLAYWDEECAGLAVFFPVYSTFLAQPGLYLEDLYVRASHRGQGIGMALLRHLAGIAVARGCGRLEWGVLDWNEPAIQFYEKLGAAPVRGWTKYRLSGEALGTLAATDPGGTA